MESSSEAVGNRRENRRCQPQYDRWQSAMMGGRAEYSGVAASCTASCHLGGRTGTCWAAYTRPSPSQCRAHTCHACKLACRTCLRASLCTRVRMVRSMSASVTMPFVHAYTHTGVHGLTATPCQPPPMPLAGVLRCIVDGEHCYAVRLHLGKCPQRVGGQ